MPRQLSCGKGSVFAGTLGPEWEWGPTKDPHGETDPLSNRPTQKHCSGSSHSCTNATVTVREEMETHDQEEGRDGETRAFQQLTYFPQVSLQPAHLMIITTCFLEARES